MDPVDLLISDLGAAVVRLQAATYGSDEFRRALREALGVVYILREYRRQQEGSTRYFRRADGSRDGRSTEALVVIRGAHVHNPAQFVGPKLDEVYPSDDLFPSDHLYPGPNLWWRASPGDLDDKQAERYRSGAADRLVLESFAEASRFLSQAA